MHPMPLSLYMHPMPLLRPASLQVAACPKTLKQEIIHRAQQKVQRILHYRWGPCFCTCLSFACLDLT